MFAPTEIRTCAAFALRAMLGAFFGAARILIAAAVALVAPLCTTLLSAAAALLVLTALVFRFGAPELDFPFWAMLLLALLCAVVRFALQRLASRLAP